MVKPSPMLGKVPGNYHDQAVKTVEVRNLSMLSDNITVENIDEAELLQQPYGPPECSFAAPGILGDLRLFRVNLPIVSPQRKQPQYYLPLSCGKSQRSPQAAYDIVPFLEEELR